MKKTIRAEVDLLKQVIYVVERSGSKEDALEKLFSKRKPKPVTRVYEEHVVHGNVVTEYRIGAYRVSVVGAGDRYEYVVSPVSDLEDLYNVAGEKLDDIVLLMKKGNDPGDVLSAVLGIPRDRVADALYVLRTMLGYGKTQVLLDDPYIQDISIEGPGRVWIRHSLVEMLKPE